jgi:hypothetical protein
MINASTKMQAIGRNLDDLIDVNKRGRFMGMLESSAIVAQAVAPLNSST